MPGRYFAGIPFIIIIIIREREHERSQHTDTQIDEIIIRLVLVLQLHSGNGWMWYGWIHIFDFEWWCHTLSLSLSQYGRCAFSISIPHISLDAVRNTFQAVYYRLYNGIRTDKTLRTAECATTMSQCCYYFNYMMQTARRLMARCFVPRWLLYSTQTHTTGVREHYYYRKMWRWA